MCASILQQLYSDQVAKGKRSTNVPIQGESIRAIIDPRFDALINRATIPARPNKISPETSNGTSSPSSNSNASLVPKSSKVDKAQFLSPTYKNRLQGLLVGLALTAISVTIILSVLLTRSTASTCNTLQWNPIGVTVIGNGTNGSSLNQLNGPMGVFLDANDVLYVADTGNHRILQISSVTNGTSSGTVIAGVTSVNGTSANLLDTPRTVYVDSQQNLYIADSHNHRVQFWAYGATNGSTIAGSSSGVSGSPLNRLYNNYVVYVDQANNVYVSDSLNGRVVKWLPGASAGILVAGANGSLGYSSNQLARPIGISVDSQSNTLYIADFNAKTIVTWLPGATVGTIVAGSNSTSGNTLSLFSSPWGLIRDTYGNLYVSDYGSHRVEQFCAVGSSFTTGTTIAGVGLSQSSSRGLNYPTGIAFDSEMNLYVADYGNSRIQKFLRTN